MEMIDCREGRRRRSTVWLAGDEMRMNANKMIESNNNTCNSLAQTTKLLYFLSPTLLLLRCSVSES
jgi:hypothetical protein